MVTYHRPVALEEALAIRAERPVLVLAGGTDIYPAKAARAGWREIGGVQIQNRGTLAGNICTASPAGDGAPNLLALDASIELTSRRGRRIVPMIEFIDGYRHTQCRPDEIVTAILVPKRSTTTRG